jgi:hypothetical protein
MRAFILFLSLVIGQAALAQTLEENVRAALIAADLDQLESLIDAAQTEALTTGNHEELRHAYRRIFATTHPDYEATIRDWVAQHPDSAYAWTALGDMQFWQALAYRVCYCYRQDGPKPLGDGFVDLLPQAQLSALRAHQLDPAFVRASVLAFNTFQYGMHNFAPDEMAAETLAVAPNYRVVVEAATSTQGIYFGDFATAYAVCAKYAPRVADYTADQCAIEVALTTNTGGDAQWAARAAVIQDPSPLFDGLRLDAHMRANSAPQNAEALMKVHAAQLVEVADIDRWLKDAERLGHAVSNTFYREEARQLALTEARKRLLDDPRNPWLALFLIEQVPTDPTLPPLPPPGELSVDRQTAIYEQTSALWRAALPFGYQSGQFWLEGVSADVNLYRDKRAGAIAAIPYVENALILSGHNEYTITELFERYVWFAYDSFNYDRVTDTSSYGTLGRPSPPEEVRCTLGRLARMVEFVCPSDPQYTWICQNGRPGDEVKDILLKLQEPDFCPAVAAMSPSALAYTELRPIPGFDPATYEGPAAAP